MAQFLDKQGLTTYSNLIKGELDALDARIEALETGGKYMPVTGGTFTGNVAFQDMSGNKPRPSAFHINGADVGFDATGGTITNILTPENDKDVANKAYVDSTIANKAPYLKTNNDGSWSITAISTTYGKFYGKTPETSFSTDQFYVCRVAAKVSTDTPAIITCYNHTLLNHTSLDSQSCILSTSYSIAEESQTIIFATIRMVGTSSIAVYISPICLQYSYGTIQLTEITNVSRIDIAVRRVR